ncbi:MAG: phosphate acyltransferase [Xanthobacteraceae bacterium]
MRSSAVLDLPLRWQPPGSRTCLNPGCDRPARQRGPTCSRCTTHRWRRRHRLRGPLAFGTAVSSEAAAIKQLVSPVAGCADIFIVPDLEAGNMLAKQLEYLGGAKGAGIVLDARVPIILTSVRTPPRCASLRLPSP